MEVLRRRSIGVVLWALVTTAAHAQLAPVGVPKGLVRLEIDGQFGAFGDMYADGHRESYAADLNSPALGSDRIPALAAVDASVGAIIGNAGFHLNLGQLSADAEADVSTAVLGAGVGLTDHLTVFGRLPLVRSRVQSLLTLDPTTADAGLVPATDQQTAFFQQFTDALGTLNAKLAAGDYNGNASQKALAQATSASGAALHDNLFALLGNPSASAPFAPTAASAAGVAIAAQIAALQSTLTSLNVTGFTLVPTLPAQALTADDFAAFLSASNGLGYRTGDVIVQYRGDAEVGAAYTLIDTWNRAGRLGGVRVALSSLLRLPTGLRARPDRLLDPGTGDGQTDAQIELVTDLGGRRWGTRLTGTYVRQFPADIVQRVTPPNEPLAGPERLATVRWNPGNVVAVGARPFYRLANALALEADVEHWRRGDAKVTYATSTAGIPGVDASVLALDSHASATTIGLGLTYADAGRLAAGGRGWPVDASCVFERVIDGTGRTPAVQRVRASLRLYFSLFR